jgi:hypothetical protein
MTVVWTRSPYKHSMKLIHLALADAVNSKDVNHCWPSMATLAKKATVSPQYLRPALRTMVEDGWLRIAEDGFYLLDPELSFLDTPSDEEKLSFQQEETQFPVDGNSVSVSRNSVSSLYKAEPEGTRREPEVEPTTLAPSGVEEVFAVKTYGRQSDDSSEMLDPEARVRPKRVPFEKAPAEGTHGWLVSRFSAGVTRCGSRGFNRGMLNGTLRSLRDDGLTNAEIDVLIQTFFVRWEQDVRAKRGEVDPVQMFRHRLPQLQVQAKEQVENVRTGRETAVDRSRVVRDDLMKRMGILKGEQ